MPVADRERVEGEGKAPQRLWRVVPEVERPRAPAWLVGKLVHEALAAWRLPGTEKTAAFGDWVRARARAQGLIDGGQITHALRRSRRLLLQLQENALFEEIETAERRLHEVPFSVERDGRIDSGQIDLLYLTDGVWTMVELKTDRVRNREHFEAVLREKAYVDQARRYADAAEELLGRRPRCLLWMLDYGRGTRVYSVPAAGLLQCTHG
jgi:ATP-dependent exoDNAse (exonuclease V) beta subunit